MFEKLLNAKIVKLQAQLTRDLGESKAAEIIRMLDKQARENKDLRCFAQYGV